MTLQTQKETHRVARSEEADTHLRRFLIALFYVVAATLVLFVFIARPGIEGHPRAGVHEVIYGKAHRPYVYRTLLPTTVRVIAAITPDGIENKINDGFYHKRFVRILDWDRNYTYEYLVAIVLMWCCFLGFAFVLRRLVQVFYDYPPLVADIAPVLGLICLPVFFRYFSYLYDPPNLLLFALAVLVVYRRRLLPVYGILLLAALNKETSILIVGLFVVREYGVRRTPALVAQAGLMVGVWAGVRGTLAIVYRDNPGNWIENYFMEHNLRLAVEHPFSLALLIGLTVLFAALIRRGWREKPTFLRRGLFVTLIPLATASLLIGFIDELRVYYEVVPFLYLLSLPTIVNAFGGPWTAAAVDGRR